MYGQYSLTVFVRWWRCPVWYVV